MTDYSKIKVLVAEDSGVTLGMEVETLKEMGFSNIRPAKNGSEAIRILKEESDIGLIVSDWNMPIHNGYELLVWVRSIEKLREIPFVMATAHGERRQAAKAIEAGVTDFITKPFTAGELKTVVDGILGFETEAVRKAVSPKTADGKTVLRAAHIQITDHLILGVMENLAAQSDPSNFKLETICMPSWNPVRDALEKGDVDAAFILAPLAMDMFASGSDIRLTLLTHKNGSTCVRKKGKMASLADFFEDRAFYIPHILSVHHMLSDMFLREAGLKPGLVGKEGVNVFFEVVPPIMMPNFLSKSSNGRGFMVAEPIAANAVDADRAELMYLSGELWENHPCCVVAMRAEFIKAHEDATYEFIRLLVEAGRFVADNPEASAKIGLDFLDPDGKQGLSLPILEKVLREPAGIKTDSLLPEREHFELIQRYMVLQMGIGTTVDLDGFLDLRFAEAACRHQKTETKPSIFHGPAHIVKKLQTLREAPAAPKPAQPAAGSVFEIKENESSVIFTISSESMMVNRVVREAREFMTRYGVDSCPECLKVLNELLINAVRHGNRNQPEKRIVCELGHLGDLLFRFTVEDRGGGFDYRQIGTDDSDELRQTGFAIVRTFAEQIEFNEKGNRVSVLIKIPRQTAYYTWDENDWAVIQPTGNITASSADELKKILMNLVESGHERYRFDFEKVGDIDSISLTVFVVFVKMLARRDMASEIEIVNANDNIVNLFGMTRLDKHYLFM